VAQITVDAKGRITGASNVALSTLPSQTGNSGKYLTTNGSTASWASFQTSGSFRITMTGSSITYSHYFGNVASVTRTATGLFTITFSPGFPDADFTCAGLGERVSSGDIAIVSRQNDVPWDTTHAYVVVNDQTGTKFDAENLALRCGYN
jgi:hypothetical protein